MGDKNKNPPNGGKKVITITFTNINYSTNIDGLKDKPDIVGVISQYVALKQKGHNYWGLCPFHIEKTPSFSVNQEKQMYYCFSCHTGGDVYKFVMSYFHMDFKAAKESLGMPSENSCHNKQLRINQTRLARQNQADAIAKQKAVLKNFETDLVDAERRCHRILSTVINERSLELHSVIWAIKTKPIIESFLDEWFNSDDNGKAELLPTAKGLSTWPF